MDPCSQPPCHDIYHLSTLYLVFRKPDMGKRTRRNHQETLIIIDVLSLADNIR